MSETLIAAPPRPPQLDGKRSLAVLIVILTGQFMAVLDASIVIVAIPSIRDSLHASGAGLQLIVAGYVIAYAVLLVTGARLGDRISQRTAFISGLTIFTAASLACGLAWNEPSLIVFRFLQGIGAAAMVPQVMTLIQRTFADAARARALSIYAAIISGGMVAGQLLGGLLVDLDIAGSGWRGVFLVNVPIGIALLIFAPKTLPRTDTRGDRAIDGLGLATLTATVLLLVVPLVLGRELGFPVWSWICLAAGVIGVFAFVAVQRRVAASGRDPLFSPTVIRAPGLVVTAATLFLIMLSFGGWLFVIAIHMQSDLGYTALEAGVRIVPMSVTFAAGGLYWNRVPAQWHPRMIVAGLALAAIAMAWLGLLLRDGSGLDTFELIASALIGLGSGFAFSPLMTRALVKVPITVAADASGILVTCVQLGIVAGISISGSLLFTLLDHTSPEAAVALAHGLSALVTAGATVTAALAVRATSR
ncbi:MFS transporter [Nocardia camponoti]|uniref:MFS transporter n=1 Tax=Nocardia camponoti TaxID=1616106 RepID=A0A917Q8Q7_9NOCA|nr:MFS transporter [Nocardia camponoti]GGK34968.1 MFS transporter [Nocardia camponoti]